MLNPLTCPCSTLNPLSAASVALPSEIEKLFAFRHAVKIAKKKHIEKNNKKENETKKKMNNEKKTKICKCKHKTIIINCNVAIKPQLSKGIDAGGDCVCVGECGSVLPTHTHRLNKLATQAKNSQTHKISCLWVGDRRLSRFFPPQL